MNHSNIIKLEQQIAKLKFLNPFWEDDDELGYDFLAAQENIVIYEAILQKILKEIEKPKRVVDVGANLNEYAFLFTDQGIDYVGIDPYPKQKGWTPITNENIKHIPHYYQEVKENFKNDVLISSLCIGYLVKIEEVLAKHLIINGNCSTPETMAKLLWLGDISYFLK